MKRKTRSASKGVDAGNQLFRRMVLTITEREATALHAAKLEWLASKTPGVHLRCLGIERDVPLYQFNCVMYALNLVGTLETVFAQVDLTGADFLADTAFLSDIIHAGLVESVDASSVQQDDIVVYFDSNQVRHCGKWVSENRCRSKWGAGLIYEHGLFDVPNTYGDDVRFFLKPNLEVLRNFITERHPGVTVRGVTM